jgi:hypothetical protein
MSLSSSKRLLWLACLAFSASLFAAEVPRPAGEFVFQLPNGTLKHLSDYKGKLVALIIISPS